VRRLGGIPCVFAEYVSGGSLAEWIDTGRLYEGRPGKVLERVLDIAIQFAWGLHHAHEQGLVHQDVKPGNVLVTEGGVVKVSDFGLARARGRTGEAGHGDGQRSSLVSYQGMTPAYCSPEQQRGERLSHTTDVWSWGVSLLEMVLGQGTWRDGPSAPKALESYLAGGVASARLPVLPPALADLLRHCLQVDPGNRQWNLLGLFQRR
jgi:serine/threonine protein kinase